MENAKSSEDLFVWKKAYKFTLAVYHTTKSFPKAEKYELVSQFRRAAVSVIANIAEGFRKLSKADKLRFYNIAQGSLSECRCYVILSHDLNCCDTTELLVSVQEVSKLLDSYCMSIHDSLSHPKSLV